MSFWAHQHVATHGCLKRNPKPKKHFLTPVFIETNNTKTKTISGNSKDQNSHSLESINILVNEPKKLQSKVSINNIDNTNLQPSDEEMNLMSYNENDRLTHLNDNNNNNNNLIDNSHQEESNSHPQKHIGQKFKFNREGMVKNFKCETWRRRFLRISFSVYFLQTGAYLAVTLRRIYFKRFFGLCQKF